MPFVKSRYPKDWKAISKRIRARSGGRCECTGQCGVEHEFYLERCVEQHNTAAIHFKGKVILTVAHLNHVGMDCRDENMKAMCQRCHLRYDQKHHQANARKTRRSKKAHGELF